MAIMGIAGWVGIVALFVVKIHPVIVEIGVGVRLAAATRGCIKAAARGPRLHVQIVI